VNSSPGRESGRKADRLRDARVLVRLVPGCRPSQDAHGADAGVGAVGRHHDEAVWKGRHLIRVRYDKGRAGGNKNQA
jgi:hypothetical protein